MRPLKKSFLDVTSFLMQESIDLVFERADIGAGTGHLRFPLPPIVEGSAGYVDALDILQTRAAKNLSNVETVLG